MSLAKGHASPWTAWIGLHRIRIGVKCSKEPQIELKYFNGDTTCERGQTPETTKHNVTMPITSTSLNFGRPSEIQQKCQKVCREMEECGLMTRKKKHNVFELFMENQLYSTYYVIDTIITCHW